MCRAGGPRCEDRRDFRNPLKHSSLKGRLEKRIAALEKIEGTEKEIASNKKMLEQLSPPLTKEALQERIAKAKTPEEIESLGKDFSTLLEEKFGKGFFDKEENKAEAQEKIVAMMSEHIEIGGKPSFEVYGSAQQRKVIDESIQVLPTKVLEEMGTTPIAIINIDATMRKQNNWDGTEGFYSRQQQIHQANLSPYKLDEWEAEDYEHLDEKMVDSKNILINNEFFSGEEGQGVIRHKGELVKVWIGPSVPKKNKYNQVSYRKLYKPGETVDKEGKPIDMPIYIAYIQKDVEAETIGINEYRTKKDGTYQSVALHEFVHAAQRRSSVDRNGEALTSRQMFEKLAQQGKASRDEEYSYYDSFPDKYMGETGGNELLTRATEGLFHPEKGDNGFFYGKNRHANADNVRNWIIGYWLKAGNR